MYFSNQAEVQIARQVSNFENKTKQKVSNVWLYKLSWGFIQIAAKCVLNLTNSLPWQAEYPFPSATTSSTLLPPCKVDKSIYFSPLCWQPCNQVYNWLPLMGHCLLLNTTQLHRQPWHCAPWLLTAICSVVTLQCPINQS